MEDTFKILETQYKIPREVSIYLLNYYDAARNTRFKVEGPLAEIMKNNLAGGDREKTIKLILVLFSVLSIIFLFLRSRNIDRASNIAYENFNINVRLIDQWQRQIKELQYAINNNFSTIVWYRNNRPWLTHDEIIEVFKEEIYIHERDINEAVLEQQSYEDAMTRFPVLEHSLILFFLYVLYLTLRSIEEVQLFAEKVESTFFVIQTNAFVTFISILAFIQRVRRQETYTDSVNVVLEALRQHFRLTQRLRQMYTSLGTYVKRTSFWNYLFPPGPGPLRVQETTCPVCLNDYDGIIYKQTRCCYDNGHTCCLECYILVIERFTILTRASTDYYYVPSCPVCMGPIFEN